MDDFNIGGMLKNLLDFITLQAHNPLGMVRVIITQPAANLFS
jgi:hypothetical protein